MIKIILLIISVFVLYGLNDTSSGKNNTQYKNADSTFSPEALISIDDAEKILGEPVLQKENTYTTENGASVFRSSYTALKEDTKTGKTGIVYFMFESYNTTEEAKEIYSSIKRSNEDHEGVKEIKDMGNEAYYHSSENFYFIIVRKNDKIFRLKVNKTTSKTSDEEFMLTAARIAGAM